MIDSVVFIGAIIIAITQAVKITFPNVNGAVTILVAILVGILVAVFSTPLGIVSISVAQGILTALAAVGVHTTVSRIGS